MAAKKKAKKMGGRKAGKSAMPPMGSMPPRPASKKRGKKAGKRGMGGGY